MNKKIMLEEIVKIPLSIFCAIYVLKGLNVNWNTGLWFVVGIALWKLFSEFELGKVFYYFRDNKLILFFSTCFSIMLILGAHIETGDLYQGLKEENYISPYSFNDVIAVFVLIFVISLTTITLVNHLKVNSFPKTAEPICGVNNKKEWLLISVGLFVCWIPYFLVYYPGFILGDSLNSVWQIEGIIPWSNHHPILYTAFIEVCLKIGTFLKNPTFGCAIYTIIQMGYIAGCLGYIICWLSNKKIPRIYNCFVFVLFALVPFFAQISIAMWKDPAFSATAAVWSLLLFDIVISRGRTLKKRWAMAKHAVLMLGICFLRNNGIYIILFTEVILIGIILLNKKRFSRVLKRFSVLVVCVLLLVGGITGPLYSLLGLQGETVESLGVFLNQMARVVAYDGDMSEEDKEFMDNLLPIEEYEEKYYPCCIDRLKWDENFNQDYLENHKAEFLKTWISMFLKNPICYFEAWELNTFGYWAANYWEANADSSNISKGNLESIKTLENCGIVPHNLLANDVVDLTRYIRNGDTIIGLGIVNWVVFFAGMICVFCRKTNLLLGLAPSVGNIITFLIAAPHAYWQRYGILNYYMLPVYIALILWLLRSRKVEEINVGTNKLK